MFSSHLFAIVYVWECEKLKYLFAIFKLCYPYSKHVNLSQRNGDRDREKRMKENILIKSFATNLTANKQSVIVK